MFNLTKKKAENDEEAKERWRKSKAFLQNPLFLFLLMFLTEEKFYPKNPANIKQTKTSVTSEHALC